MNLTGVKHGSKCLSVFPRSRVGFVVADGLGGQIITSQPTVPIPVLKSLALDDAGRPIIAPGGGYEENDPPAIDSLIGADHCGKQWRIQGRSGHSQILRWDGCKFILEADDQSKELVDYPQAAPGECGVKEAVLIVGDDGIARLGYRNTQTVAAGCCMIWPGPWDTVPAGWSPCDGRSLSPTQYVELFTAIGYAHGNDAGNFRVPDPRGYFMKFTDNGAGIDLESASRVARYPGGNVTTGVGSVHLFSTPKDASANRAWNMYFNMIIYLGCVADG